MDGSGVGVVEVGVPSAAKPGVEEPRASAREAGAMSGVRSRSVCAPPGVAGFTPTLLRPGGTLSSTCAAAAEAEVEAEAEAAEEDKNGEAINREGGSDTLRDSGYVTPDGGHDRAECWWE